MTIPKVRQHISLWTATKRSLPILRPEKPNILLPSMFIRQAAAPPSLLSGRTISNSVPEFRLLLSRMKATNLSSGPEMCLNLIMTLHPSSWMLTRVLLPIFAKSKAQSIPCLLRRIQSLVALSFHRPVITRMKVVQ